MVVFSGNIQNKDKILTIRVRSIWLIHGALAAIGSIVSSVISLFSNGGPKSITHWWVEIKTENGWYCAQFDGSGRLALTRHYSKKGVTEEAKEGKKGAYTKKEQKNKTTKFAGKVKNCRIDDVIHFMNKYDGNYSLVGNNCQNFAEDLFYYLSNF